MSEVASLHQPNEYSAIPVLLTRQVPAFANSLEYALLSETERRLPGVVCAAFTKFLAHIQTKEPRTPQDDKTLGASYGVIESLASSANTEVVNVLVTEVFENLDDEVSGLVRTGLGPKARELYDRWIM